MHFLRIVKWIREIYLFTCKETYRKAPKAVRKRRDHCETTTVFAAHVRGYPRPLQVVLVD